jgi:hypothetical protein
MRRLLTTVTVVLVLARQGTTAIRSSNVFAHRAVDDIQDDNASKRAERGKDKESPTASPAPSFSKMPSASLSPSCGGGMECDDPAPKVENEIDNSSHGELSLFNPPDRIDEPKEDASETNKINDVVDVIDSESSLLREDESSANSIQRLPLAIVAVLLTSPAALFLL